MVGNYIQCLDCGFVLLADGDTEPDPKPKRVDSCPGCGGVDFGFVEE